MQRPPYKHASIMNEPLLTFQRFNDIGLATEFADKLTQLGIYCEIDNQTVPFDVTYANNPLEDDIRIKLRPHDFVKANNALDEYYRSQFDTLDKDYYLFGFTNDELLEVIAKPDEWNRLDYQLAQKLLKERGAEIQPGTIEELNKERIITLSKTEGMSAIWIYAGYIAAVLGGLIGIIIGLLLVYARKTLPNGTRVYLNTSNQRLHGKAILAISVVSLIFWNLLNPSTSLLRFFRTSY